jgi:branched-subunit amino acid ABC-type transport system permease component
MSSVRVAADVFMGLLLGAFLYAGAASLWPALRRPEVAVVVVAVAVAAVLFRRPNGSLARRHGRLDP